MNRFDAIIIGTGQAGPSLADRLAKAGAAINRASPIRTGSRQRWRISSISRNVVTNEEASERRDPHTLGRPYKARRSAPANVICRPRGTGIDLRESAPRRVP